MDTLVLFSSPLLLVLYGIALAFMLFEVFTRATGFVCPLIALAIVIGASIYGLLIGVSLPEIAIVGMVFLLLSLLGMRRKKE